MFKADKVVTVIRCTTDGAADQTRCACRTFAGCSWYSDHAVRAERSGAAPSPAVKVRIPAQAIQAMDPGWTPKAGDWLVLGAAKAEDDAGLSALRKRYETARVKVWHDHRNTVFPHIYLEGSL